MKPLFPSRAHLMNVLKTSSKRLECLAPRNFENSDGENGVACYKHLILFYESDPNNPANALNEYLQLKSLFLKVSSENGKKQYFWNFAIVNFKQHVWLFSLHLHFIWTIVHSFCHTSAERSFSRLKLIKNYRQLVKKDLVIWLSSILKDRVQTLIKFFFIVYC